MQLQIQNEYFISFYCKNDICIAVRNDYSGICLSIPDENGKLINYIVKTCSLEKAIIGKCINSTSNALENKCSSICKYDSDCLSNKCVNKFCVFNDETPIVHCDDIYTEPGFLRFSSSYMYYGNPAGDSCLIIY